MSRGREQLFLTLLIVAAATLMTVLLGTEIAAVFHAIERGLAG